MTVVAESVRLATAGIGVVGVSFGMARYGYGLLLPDIRQDYALSASWLGVIGTGSYVAYLAATALTGTFTIRVGARRTAVSAALVAALGMTIAGVSRTPTTLAVGILIAGASAGLAYAPFSDAIRSVPPVARGRVLSAINCGTGYGVAVAAAITILAGVGWRGAWLAFAAVALLAGTWAAVVMRGPDDEPADWRAPAYGWTSVLCRRAVPLLLTALLLGAGSAAFWTFAVEHLSEAGALSPAASRGFLGVVGVASILATLAADLVRRLGAARAYTAATLAQASGVLLLALLPMSPAVALAAAVLFGAAYNGAVAIQAIWSTHLFARRPSLGLSAALTANGSGLLLGTLGAGVLADRLGTAAVLSIGAALVALAGVLRPGETILPWESGPARVDPVPSPREAAITVRRGRD